LSIFWKTWVQSFKWHCWKWSVIWFGVFKLQCVFHWQLFAVFLYGFFAHIVKQLNDLHFRWCLSPTIVNFLHFWNANPDVFKEFPHYMYIFTLTGNAYIFGTHFYIVIYNFDFGGSFDIALCLYDHETLLTIFGVYHRYQ
jgi:hypothetical protein